MLPAVLRSVAISAVSARGRADNARPAASIARHALTGRYCNSAIHIGESHRQAGCLVKAQCRRQQCDGLATRPSGVGPLSLWHQACRHSWRHHRRRTLDLLLFSRLAICSVMPGPASRVDVVSVPHAAEKLQPQCTRLGAASGGSACAKPGPAHPQGYQRYARTSGARPRAVIVGGLSWPLGCRPRTCWRRSIADWVPAPHTPSTAPL